MTVTLRRILLGRDPAVTLRRAVLVAALTYLVVRHVCMPVRLHGISMEPTLHDGSMHPVNLLRYAFRPPQRGDIVVISMAGDHAFYLKRVLGLPGDTVAFRNGRLYVNRIETAEPYVAELGDWNMPDLLVPTNEYFVAGDNRSVPFEEHVLGTVSRQKIVGGPL